MGDPFGALRRRLGEEVGEAAGVGEVLQERRLGDQQLALEDAGVQGADDPQAQRPAAVVEELELAADSQVQDPLHRVGVADRRDHARLERLLEQPPGLLGAAGGGREAEAAALDEGAAARPAAAAAPAGRG